MKTINKYLNTLNIFEVLFLVIFNIIINGVSELYPFNYHVIEIVFFVVLIFNLFFGILNLKQKNKFIGISSIIIGGYSLLTAICIFIKLNTEMESFNKIFTFIALFEFIIVIVLSIINLIINRKLEKKNNTKIPFIIFLMIILLNIIIISMTIFIHFKNVKLFNEAMDTMKNFKEEETYMALSEKKDYYIFLDKNGKEITKISTETEINHYTPYDISGNIVYLGIGNRNKKTVIVNSMGTEICVFGNELYFDKFLDSYNKQYSKYYIHEYKKTQPLNTPVKLGENYLQISDIHEKSTNNSMYFENPEWDNNTVLQVVIKDELETDTKLLDIYEEYKYALDDILDYDKINNFYKYKKDYYLVNLNDSTSKIKLDCNNLIYEAEYTENSEESIEKIILFSNGYIPFYDEQENGYFNLQGEKLGINSENLIYDTIGNNCFVLDAKNKKTIIYSLINNKSIINKIDSIVLNYGELNIAYPINDGGNYQFLNQDANNISDKFRYAPKILNENLILEPTSDNYYNIYCYDIDKNKLKKSDYKIIEIEKIQGLDSYRSSNIYDYLFIFEKYGISLTN